jgi:hypothetical protein
MKWIFIFIFTYLIISCNTSSVKSHDFILHNTNEDYLKALDINHLEVLDTIEVFNFVFKSLSDEIKIYPTENHYYFELILNGRNFKGNIGLLIDERDSGYLSFAVEEDCQIDTFYYTPISIEKVFTEKDGLTIEKIDTLQYDVRFKGTLKKISLQNIINTSTVNDNITTNEIPIGVCQDESGLKFNLLFDSTTNHFFYSLNKYSYANENFIRITVGVVIGIRTGFVFYLDSANSNRLILFGVSLKNITENTIFDGPFDQLPDNYWETNSHKLNLLELFGRCYPDSKNKISKYGIFKENPEERIAISSYLSYRNIDEVLKVWFSCKNTSESNYDFIYNLTQDRTLKSD